MSPFLTRITSGVVLLAGLVSAASAESVVSPAKRQQSLERAKAFVSQREIAAVNVDPFNPPAFAEAVASMGRVTAVANPVAPVGGGAVAEAPKAGPRTDRDLLIAIAGSLKSPNSVVIGGQPTLLFGQKRVKAGGILTITFEGTQYTLEVIAIDRTTFTLRLNREEYTRNIK